MRRDEPPGCPRWPWQRSRRGAAARSSRGTPLLAQAVSPRTLAAIVRATEFLAGTARPSPAASVEDCRAAVDSVDAGLARLLERRATLVARIERIKLDSGVPIRDRRREAEVTDRVARLAPQLGRTGVTAVMTAVIDACVATALADG